MKKDTGIKIEHGIPIAKRYKNGDIAETLRRMKVGDSFTYPVRLRSNVYCAAGRLKDKIVLCTRKCDDENVRIWRVE